MQEWVETLRSKLREMKILSPRENLYTKLPEIRPPLLPTRDPTSPLPAPPPVPAAIVPGVERVVPPSIQQSAVTPALENYQSRNSVNAIPFLVSDDINNSSTSIETTTITTNSTITSTTTQAPSSILTPQLTAMSNTLTQNLLNMLSDPITAYSEQINDANFSSSLDPDDFVTGTSSLSLDMNRDLNLSESSTEEEFIGPLLRKPSANTSDSNFSFCKNSVRLDVLASHRASAGKYIHL